MNFLRICNLSLMVFLGTSALQAAENLKDSPFSASLELSTKYMWRGIEYGTAPTVFPMIGYNTHGFNAFAMGAYAIDGSHQEVDLGVSYTSNGFTVGVSDYYYPSSVGEKDDYFKLSNRETGHWVEAYATWAGTKNVELVDFPATLMLGAICEELAQRGCNVHGNTPSNVDAYKFIVDSGFFNEMYDENNRKIYKPGNSKIMIVQRGEDRITGDNLLSFVNLLNKTKEHLGVREDADIDDYVAILKEICGNSTEWGNVVRKNWTIGAKFEDGHVDFVALDLGQGILRSLKKRVDKQLTDFIQNKDNSQVLEGVFNRYYGSRSNDSNRNQGLPFIKGCNTKNVISQLHVITNNVLLDFSNQSNDKSFASYNNGLIGTLYSWSVNADCLTQ